MYDMNDEWCFAQSKERELERQVDQTQTQGYVPRFEPLALRPRLHHRVGFLIHYLVHRGLPPRRIFTTREYRTPLSNTASQTRGRPVAKQPQHLYRRGLQPPSSTSHKREQTTISTSTKEGANTNPIQQPQPLPKREQHKKSRVYNKWYVSTTNLFPFSTKQDPK